MKGNVEYIKLAVPGLVYLSNYDEMCDVIRVAVLELQQYNDTGLVLFPINAIFDYRMNTSAGFSFFRSASVNGKV